MEGYSCQALWAVTQAQLSTLSCLGACGQHHSQAGTRVTSSTSFRHHLPLSRSSEGHGVFLLLEMTSSPFTEFFVGASALLLLQFQ